jgi:hypothetical protein
MADNFFQPAVVQGFDVVVVQADDFAADGFDGAVVQGDKVEGAGDGLFRLQLVYPQARSTYLP